VSQFKIIAAPGKVVVQSDDFKYTGRLIIPDKAKRRPTTGTIVAVGYGVGRWETERKAHDNPIDPNDPIVTEESVFIPTFEIGQRVVCGIYSGVVVKIKEQPMFLVLNQDEILCVVEGEAELEATGIQE
jgi:co-chaperonin GroES (HSP10)